MTQVRGQRQILIQGLALIFVGLVWGLAAPATPFPRLGLAAHVQFIENGMLLALQALMLAGHPGLVGGWSIRTIVIAAWTAWPMVLSEVANAWWGTARMLPIAATQAGAGGGQAWQEITVMTAHVVAALAFIVAWGTLLLAILRRKPKPQDGDPPAPSKSATG
jgi:(hydroxyamino)benzene mutase